MHLVNRHFQNHVQESSHLMFMSWEETRVSFTYPFLLPLDISNMFFTNSIPYMYTQVYLRSMRASERVVVYACVCMCRNACNVDSYTISINVHKNNTATSLRAGRVRAESRTEHWQCDRPGFNRHNFSPDGHVLFNVDRAVHYVVPYGRIICTVHNVNLYLHRSRQGWVAPVFGHRLQLVRLALCGQTACI